MAQGPEIQSHGKLKRAKLFITAFVNIPFSKDGLSGMRSEFQVKVEDFLDDDGRVKEDYPKQILQHERKDLSTEMLKIYRELHLSAWHFAMEEQKLDTLFEIPESIPPSLIIDQLDQLKYRLIHINLEIGAAGGEAEAIAPGQGIANKIEECRSIVHESIGELTIVQLRHMRIVEEDRALRGLNSFTKN